MDKSLGMETFRLSLHPRIDVLGAVANGLDRRERQETRDWPSDAFRGMEQTLHQSAGAAGRELIRCEGGIEQRHSITD
jgi:hypothetical protein